MQFDLPLDGGHHVGPLFIPVKRRAPQWTCRGVRRFRFLRRRTPSWADRSLLRDLHRLAKVFTRDSGVQWSQDHIVPLNHPLVCGLHCEANIKLIPLEENRAKGNHTWPDMPEEQEEMF